MLLQRLIQNISSLPVNNDSLLSCYEARGNRRLLLHVLTISTTGPLVDESLTPFDVPAVLNDRMPPLGRRLSVLALLRGYDWPCLVTSQRRHTAVIIHFPAAIDVPSPVGLYVSGQSGGGDVAAAHAGTCEAGGEDEPTGDRDRMTLPVQTPGLTKGDVIQDLNVNSGDGHKPE